VAVERVPEVPPAHAHGRAAVRVRGVPQAVLGQEPAANTCAHALRRTALLLPRMREDLHAEASAQQALPGTPHGSLHRHFSIIRDN
jgi:hypothetical protein